jgi:hypothetical protein
MMFYGSMVPDSVMSLTTLGEGPKLLLARLYKFAGDEDRANPALPTLARALGTSEDKVGRWLKELQQHGFIRTVRHARKEAERFLLWHPALAASLRPDTTGDSQHDSAKPRNHNHDESAEVRNHGAMIPQIRADDSAKTASMIPQNRDRYKEKRIIEENHHQSEDSPHPKSGDDDDSTPTFKVKTLLTEFFASHGFRTPTGESPAAMIADWLAREGRDVEAGAADFLRWYGNNLRDPPGTWKHVVASFGSWTTHPKRGGLVEIRKGPQSQRDTTPQPSRYQLARLPDPFETNLRAEAV